MEGQDSGSQDSRHGQDGPGAPAAGSVQNGRGAPARATRPTRPALWALARQEFTVAAGNPKAILVFTAFFPQFVVAGAYASSYLLLGATFLALEVVAMAAYALLGARVGRLAQDGRAMRWFNRVSGGMMIGFGVLLATVRRQS